MSCLSLLRVQVGCVQPVTDAQARHRLSLGERLAHTGEAVGDVVAQAVVFAGVNADHKALVLSGDGDQLAQHRAQLTNIIDFLADNIAAGDIGIGGDGADDAQLLAHILLGARRPCRGLS